MIFPRKLAQSIPEKNREKFIIDLAYLVNKAQGDDYDKLHIR